jgi:hypothetical protein
MRGVSVLSKMMIVYYKENGEIVAISPRANLKFSEYLTLEIEWDFGIKFLKDEENLSCWEIYQGEMSARKTTNQGPFDLFQLPRNPRELIANLNLKDRVLTVTPASLPVFDTSNIVFVTAKNNPIKLLKTLELIPGQKSASAVLSTIEVSIVLHKNQGIKYSEI